MRRRHKMEEREMELARVLMAECQTTEDIQAKLKKLFAGTIVQMLEAKMDTVNFVYHLAFRECLQTKNNVAK